MKTPLLPHHLRHLRKEMALQTLENYNAQMVEMVKDLELKQDENHGIVKLRLKTLVEIEAQHHLPSLPVPFHALFFLFVAEGRTINTKEESPSESQASISMKKNYIGV